MSRGWPLDTSGLEALESAGIRAQSYPERQGAAGPEFRRRLPFELHSNPDFHTPNRTALAPYSAFRMPN